mmetsp:Transcript_8980/g.10304  ORF Transcript_8980/g.10304 Transcript_8980/m.10304 type:complete len:292 (-) Transcript_8980:1354-2229(-)
MGKKQKKKKKKEGHKKGKHVNREKDKSIRDFQAGDKEPPPTSETNGLANNKSAVNSHGSMGSSSSKDVDWKAQHTYELTKARPDLWDGDKRLPAPLSQVQHNRVISDNSIRGAETDIGRAIENANERLLCRGRDHTLTCDDVAKHTAFLASQRQALKDHMENLQKRMKVFHSLIRQQAGFKSSASNGFGSSSGQQVRGRNVNRYLANIASLEKQIAATKRDSIRFNLILDQFLSSPAYATMLNSFEKVAQRTPSGHMVVGPTEDMMASTNMSFEEMLEQEKALMREESKLM